MDLIYDIKVESSKPEQTSIGKRKRSKNQIIKEEEV